MANVYLKFVKRPPERVRLKGEWWRFYHSYEGKNGKYARVFFQCETDGREVELASGRSRTVEHQLFAGILVLSGTPQRGLATELRRLGIAELLDADAGPIA